MSNHVGILSTGIYLPKGRMTAKEISELTKGVWSEEAVIEKLGIVEKVIPGDGPEDGTQEMGALAAIDAIKNANIDPLEIDVILSVTEEYKEYPLTTSALYIQDRIKAYNAWGIDVQNRCCTTVSAMKMAKDMLLADDEIDTILVVGGYRNGDFVDYTDRHMSMMYNLGAGGTLSRTAGVEIGGICNPITAENLEEAKRSLRLFDPEKMKNRLNEVSMPNWYKCIDEALRKSNLERKDIDFLNILHIKRSGHKAMLEEFGLNDDQTIYLEKYGHLGQIDQILTLHLAQNEGKIKDGDVIITIAAGIGYVWAANVIKWGPYNQ
jgi:3-oxoacyl-[acyl-carrier-protein] synthase-3